MGPRDAPSTQFTDRERGVVFKRAARELRVVPIDAPLVAVGPASAQLSPWVWPANWSESNGAHDMGSASFNLFNNLWGCNYIYWYPWRNRSAAEDDAAMAFRWRLAMR